MTSLLKSSTPHKPKQGRAQNAINGSDAESFALARIVLACRGEGHWGSREEDNSKIDLILSSEHPWSKGERMLLLCQVKSGKSFGERLGEGFLLKAAAKKAAKRTTHNICVVWVDRDDDEIFWADLNPQSNLDTQLYGSHHKVTPAMAFDLARSSSELVNANIGGKGLTIPQTAGAVSMRRRSALNTYRSLGKLHSPVLGDIEMTRYGWRHMFRRSRAAENKSASIDLIPHLPKLVTRCPSRSTVTATNYYSTGEYEYRSCDHLLEFDGMRVLALGNPIQKSARAYIKVTEEIRYPTDWASRAMLSQVVDRRVVLKSAYYKNL